ncbi:VOC family protein [Streptomyces caelestis]|uniref:VOC family protein n=1 Tax=Streptomyces caelestis TaxID=36816 RepID=UPI003450728F
MSVEFDHTIVPTRDREKSARSLARIPGPEAGEPAGVFPPVTTANGVTPDFATVDIDIPAQHYAFLVPEDGFDAILTRLVDAGIPVRADPHGRHSRRINRDDGGRGVYFRDPAGHGLEAITLPYGTDPASPLNGVTEEVPKAV